MTSTEATEHQAPTDRRSTGRVNGQPFAQPNALSDYFGQHHRMFEGTELATILEPRRIQAPPGCHSAKCVSAGLFTLLSNRVLKEAAGLPQVPTEIAAHVVV